jgi:polyphosphate kinase
MKIYQTKQQPTEIAFHAADTGWVMRITADRRIEVNEDVEVTEAAQKVLDAIQHLLTPQQRTWVGLTDEEFDDITAYANPHCDELAFAQAIEAKLKEKNT